MFGIEVEDRLYPLGLRPGDVIVAINGMTISDDATFVEALAGLMPGDVMQLTVLYASGERATLEIHLGAD